MAWNRPSENGRARTPAAPRRTRSVHPAIAVRGAVAATIVVVGLVLVTRWLFSQGDEENATIRSESQPSVLRTLETTTPVTHDSSPVDVSVKSEIGGNDARAEDLPPPKPGFKYVTNEYTHAILQVPELDKTPKPLPSATDETLYHLALTASGKDMPPVPMETRGFDENFKKSLEKTIEIFPDDSEHVKEMKETVIAMREELKELIKGGRSPEEALREYERVSYENNTIRNNAYEEAKAILEAGDVDDARKYVNTMNIAFQQMGIPEIEMPKTKAQRVAEMREQRRLRHEMEKNKQGDKE